MDFVFIVTMGADVSRCLQRFSFNCTCKLNEVDETDGIDNQEEPQQQTTEDANESNTDLNADVEYLHEIIRKNSTSKSNTSELVPPDDL